MANTTSAKKRPARSHAARKSTSPAVRAFCGFIRKVEEAIASGDQVLAQAALKAAQPELMRAATKGVLHANTASRKVSRLMNRVKSLSA
ncbi:30S ribosomal protein S20 [Rhizobium sp. RCAM05350]|nr:30S ribosomal protein S20 [Rhizobium sp. RCAM05350]